MMAPQKRGHFFFAAPSACTRLAVRGQRSRSESTSARRRRSAVSPPGRQPWRILVPKPQFDGCQCNNKDTDYQVDGHRGCPLEFEYPRRHDRPKPGDKVQPLLPYRKRREGGYGEDRDYDTADPGVLRLRSTRKSEDPLCDKPEPTE